MVPVSRLRKGVVVAAATAAVAMAASSVLVVGNSLRLSREHNGLAEGFGRRSQQVETLSERGSGGGPARPSPFNKTGFDPPSKGT